MARVGHSSKFWDTHDSWECFGIFLEMFENIWNVLEMFGYVLLNSKKISYGKVWEIFRNVWKYLEFFGNSLEIIGK